MRLMVMAAAASLLSAPACMAANAHNPYGNIDHRNDAGNDTGDAQVDRLNAAQLGAAARYRPRAAQPYGYPVRPYAGAIYAPAPRAYYPPPQAVPPGYYPPPY